MSAVWSIVRIVAAALLVLGAFNLLLDPFGFAGWPLPGSISRTGRLARDRFVKPWDIVIQEPETILMGTSRVKLGFDPVDAPASFGKTYNAAMDEAVPDEMLHLLRFAIERDHNLRTAVIELYFPLYLGRDTPSYDFTPRGHRLVFDPLIAVLSPGATWLSVTTLLRAVLDKPIVRTTRRDGFSTHPPVPIRGEIFAASYNTTNLPGLMRLGVSQATTDQVAAMQSLCTQHGIRCLFFASPLGGLVLSCIDRSGLWPLYAEWLARMRGAVAFADYSGFAIEDLNGTLQQWGDTGHFTPAVGKDMMRTLDAGTGLTPPDDLREVARQWTDRNRALAPDESCPR